MSTAFLFNNKMMKFGTHAMGISSSPTPPVPVIPANTVRVRTSDGNAPAKVKSTSYETATLVEGTSDVYDVYRSGTSFAYLLYQSTNVTEVIGANLTGITRSDYMFTNCTNLTTVNNILNTSAVENTSYMFNGCSTLTSVMLFDTSNVTNMRTMFMSCKKLTTVPSFNTSSVTNMRNMFSGCNLLTSVPLFNTSNVNRMDYMFEECSALTSVPLFNTSNATNMDYMFYKCLSVEGGALALYNQASTQTTPPSTHKYTFFRCGGDTVTGAAELAQIPSDWRSTGS